MRYTLLEAVQLILGSLDSDEVDNYDDTVESLQVANILKSVYYDMASDLQLPEHETMFHLTASGSALLPCIMTIPTTVTKMNKLQYDNKLTGETYSNFRDVNFMPLPDYLEMQKGLNGSTSDVGEMAVSNNAETFKFMYRTDRAPLWYTTSDDYTLIFDSFNSDEDTTLQASKTRAFGSTYPTFTLSNSFAADLDPTQFSLWLNRAKVRAHSELKQSPNQEAAGEARRQKIVSQYTARRVENVPGVYRAPRYGRTGTATNNIPQYLKNNA